MVIIWVSIFALHSTIERKERKKDVDVLIFFDRLAEKIREDTSSIEAI